VPASRKRHNSWFKRARVDSRDVPTQIPATVGGLLTTLLQGGLNQYFGLRVSGAEKIKTACPQVGIKKRKAGIAVVNGFCFGTGMIIAAFLCKALLHIGFCG